jgi:hypothetical protein
MSNEVLTDPQHRYDERQNVLRAPAVAAPLRYGNILSGWFGNVSEKEIVKQRSLSLDSYCSKSLDFGKVALDRREGRTCTCVLFLMFAFV